MSETTDDVEGGIVRCECGRAMIRGFTTATGCMVDVHHAETDRTFLRLEMAEPRDPRRAELLLTDKECEMLVSLLKSSGCEHGADHVHTPPPIDPADIRPGDVVERRDRITVHSLDSGAPPGFYSENAGFFSWSIVEGLRKDVSRTWHLVSRPDPDAEAVQAIRSASYNIWRRGERMDPLPGLTESLDLLAKLREQGWDVVRRAES